ncbi:hypothetical protein VE01_09216 [Pseudogymnoascus verrucosus]|uniref:Uncharacterized protein n=1 Tax=Pseudogymnoascus verrucosus TaxID=342668 RepID=A0A1B8GBA8_9PEZI|nr:uncharacterized protein VE01_09216 [Pseudogymnoascus verrucosus]OBT93125.1 hypothetical protein VE01_09216 [Pseudogymnoascus verrucosus]
MKRKSEDDEENVQDPKGEALSCMSKKAKAILAAGPLVPPHYPLIEWSTNVSRSDNPVTDFLFEFIPVEKSQNNPGSA